MHQIYPSQRIHSRQWALAVALLGASIAGCRNETEVLPNPGPEYYPLEVGAYRVYEVTDTTWRNNVPTASRFQLREQVAAELSPDVTGQPVYRVVRSRRSTPADAWAVDSVVTVTVGQRFVTEQMGNLRTVVLVFPVQKGKAWDSNAFNTLNAPDSIRVANRDYAERNRFYADSGGPFTINSSAQNYSYDNTVTVTNDLSTPYSVPTDPGGPNINNKTTSILRITFAKEIGPVYRYKRSIDHCPVNGGPCDRLNFVIGQSRREVLIESGK